jgi:hypothetical protein
VAAAEVEPGVYEAQVRFGESGAYYVYVGSATLKKGFRELPYYSLAAKAPTTPTR